MLSVVSNNQRLRGLGVVSGARSLGESDRVLVLAQLEKILRSPGFVSSPQLSKLLRFLVKESLAGRGDSLQQYRIGTEALGQPTGFDPETNAFVRVTGGRLRAKLKQYYETSGLQDTCVISLPPSGYQLMISSSRDPIGAAEPALSVGGFPVVGIIEFKGLGLPGKWQHLPVCLSEELGMLMSRAGPVRLRGPFSRRRLLEEHVEPSDLGNKYEVDYILDGSVEHRDGMILIRVRLLEGAGGVQIWSRKYQCQSARCNFGRIETEILQAIATELGADFGSIERLLIGLASLRPEGSLTVHEAILKAKAYEIDLSEKSFHSGVAALERAMVVAPNNALLHATLSVLLFFGYVEYFSIGKNFPARAVALATRALQLEPLSAWSRFSEVTAAFMLRKHEEFVILSTRLTEDPCFPLGLSGMVALLRIFGRVEEDASVKVIRLLQQQNPHYPRIFHFGLSVMEFGAHRYEAALMELDFYRNTSDPGDPLLRCAILSRQGRVAEAQIQYCRLTDEFPGLLENAPTLLARYLHPDHSTSILQAVALAGECTAPFLQRSSCM